MKKSGELTPASAALSPTTRSAVARGRSEGRSDSCYFPGCRRVTNCHCEICLASINATLDLIPSATKLSATKPVPKGALRQSESETPPATSESGSTLTTPATPPIQSTMKSRPSKKVVVEQERSCVLGDRRVCRILAGLCLLWVLDSGFSALVLRGYSPKFTAELVKKAGEESRVLLGNLNGRLEVLQKKLERVVGGEVSNCSSEDSLWELKQEGQLVFHWRCVLYKSIVEEVSVWGSPLRTSGLLTTGFSLRSQTLLSGRITEWSEGKLISNLRTMKSSSWSYKKWSLAAVQLDADTWVLEYSRNALLESSGLIPGTWEVLRLRISKLVKEMQHKPWRLLLPNAFPGFYYHHPEVRSFEYPT